MPEKRSRYDQHRERHRAVDDIHRQLHAQDKDRTDRRDAQTLQDLILPHGRHCLRQPHESARADGDRADSAEQTEHRTAFYREVQIIDGVQAELNCTPVLSTNIISYFPDYKRQEDKHYYVYMTAATNKFLRIYYGTGTACLEKL